MRFLTLAILLIGIHLSFAGEGDAPNGTLIVLSKSENKAEFFSLKSWQKIGEVPTGIAPHEVAISPDGKTAVVTNYGQRQPGNTLTVINIPDLRVIKTIDLGAYRRPHGIVFRTPDQVVVTAESKQAVLIVNIQTSHIEQVMPTRQQVSHMVVLSPDGNWGFVANIGSGSVSILDLKEGKQAGIIPAQPGTEGIAWEPGSSRIWFSNRDVNSIMVYDVASRSLIDTLQTAAFPIRIAMAPAVQFALVSCAKAGVVEVWQYPKRQLVKRISMDIQAAPDVETRLFQDRFGKSPVPIGVVVAGDGSLAFVANSNADAVAVIDLHTLNVVRYLPTAKQPDGMAWTSFTF